MIERHDYPVTIRWTEEKQGIATSSDRIPDLDIATPPEFGGPPYVWSPEHLFVASVASCFMTTFLAIAAASRLEIVSLEVPASGSLVRGEDRRYSISHIELTPQIMIAGDEARTKTERIVHKADEVCLISRSVKTEIEVHPTILVAPAEAPEPAAFM